MNKITRIAYGYVVWCAVLCMAGCTSTSSEPQPTRQPMYFLNLSDPQQVQVFLSFLHQSTSARSSIRQDDYYNNLAVSKYMEGNYTQAIEFINQTLTLRTGDTFGTAKSFNNLGVIYQAMGEYTKALELYQQAIALLQAENKTEWETYAQSNLTNLQYYLYTKPASGRVAGPPGQGGPVYFVEAEE